MNRELALYAGAGVVYVALGALVPELLLSWFEGAAFLLLAVWVLPAAVSRFRRRAGSSGEGRA